MTPPHDVLERAASMLGDWPFEMNKERQREARRLLQDLQSELHRVRAERDRLLLEREPFKVVMDSALQAGLAAGESSAAIVELAYLLGFKQPATPPLQLNLDDPSPRLVAIRNGNGAHYEVTSADVQLPAFGYEGISLTLRAWRTD